MKDWLRFGEQKGGFYEMFTLPFPLPLEIIYQHSHIFIDNEII